MARFRFHYCLTWLLLLGFAHWRLGLARTTLDEFLAIAMQLLCFPASIFAVAALALVRAGAQFWDTRLGITLGWALFFAAGYAQWFLFLPWLNRKVRNRKSKDIAGSS